MKFQECTVTVSNNRYHEDDITDQLLEYVRYTELESDAIDNIKVILKQHDKKQWENINKFNPFMIGLIVWFIWCSIIFY